MAYAVVVSTTKIGNGTADTTTDAIDTTGADLIVMGYVWFGAETPSDSKGNTWTKLTDSGATSAAFHVRMAYTRPTSVGTGHTFTITGGDYTPVFVLALSGSVASPFDVENGAINIATSIQPGSVTPTENDEIAVTTMGWENNAGTVTINESYTIIGQHNYSGGVSWGGAMAYLIQTTATATNPTWTRGAGSDDNGTRIATFKAGVAASGHPTIRRFGSTERGREGVSFRPTDIGRDGGRTMRRAA